MEQYHHFMMCAAITNGCQSALTWKSYDKEMNETHLLEHGWRISYGKWVCEKHPTEAVPLMYYGDNQEGRQVGVAVVKDGSISAVVTDEELSTMIAGDVLNHVSFGFGFKDIRHGVLHKLYVESLEDPLEGPMSRGEI